MTKEKQQSLISGMRLRALSAALACALALVIVAGQSATAQTYSLLHSFTGFPKDGRWPYAGLIRDAAGNFYGTTRFGGARGGGTIFKLDAAGKETPLFSFFRGNRFRGYKDDGIDPFAGLLQDTAGNLYGTAESGGDLTCHYPGGCGTVFRRKTSGKVKVLYRFHLVDDELGPEATLVQDMSGNLYGTTIHGGDFACDLGCGTVFKLSTTGQQTLLHSFHSGTDGETPNGVILDAAGNLYGTTSLGGVGNVGTVFKVDATGKETVVYSFQGGTDGAYPHAGLIRDAAGNLYGTTWGGGSDLGSGTGGGTVFMLDTTGKETVLFRFADDPNGAGEPMAPLIRDASGNLYGTTMDGGTGCSTCGTVFKLDTSGKETTLHNFTGADGAGPAAGLVQDGTGSLYGTTQVGGASNNGVIFKITP
jgi:uncharacterized repeat protein (TIGR03803 family)